ncbi:tudor domain-containing protein 15 [Corythoichthys intestinalis]|uniref:tudor domain-containing protein 15 n=1 Tax=Corythoichthys intestinalis TaxID=161448 RepID=UPI0025A51221|nr:tudor domain-containing protein 15 [Corythoichthys intestinalis]
MLSMLNHQPLRSQDWGLFRPGAPARVDLKITHLEWSPEDTLISFQGQSSTVCELDYVILHQEIQYTAKTIAEVEVGEYCLVEDAQAAVWYRGRVRRRHDGESEVFLVDRGVILTVDAARVSSCSEEFLNLPPKTVGGFLANVLPLADSSDVSGFLSGQIGKKVTGYHQAFSPIGILLLDVPDVNDELVRRGLGRHVDKDTFRLLFKLLSKSRIKQIDGVLPDLLADERSECASSVYQEIPSLREPRFNRGARANVRVTAGVHAGLFYCQMSSQESDLRGLSKTLAAVNERQSKSLRQKNLGPLCSVKSRSGKWYRGLAKFLPDSSRVRVLLVDYGFFEWIKVDDVHSLPPDLHSAPVAAFPCSLSSLKDEEVTARQLSFLEAGLLGGVLDVKIDAFDVERRLYLITIFGAVEKHVAEKARPVRERDQPRSAPEDRVNPVFCETLIGREMVKTLKEEKLRQHSVFEGYLEYAQDPENFWIRSQSRNDDFQKMMSQISRHFAGAKPEDDVLPEPEPGALCCALYEKDMRFYRARVTDKLERGAEVLFIDFGNRERTPAALIKKIPETFADIPAFALPCSLVNVVPADEVWTSSNSDFFRAALSDKALLVRVVRIAKRKCLVDLYEAEGDRGSDVGELMVKAKQAEYWNRVPLRPLGQNGRGQKTEIEIPQKDKGEEERSSAPLGFKTPDIRPNCELAVRCSRVNSLSDFWCQLLDKVPDLENLMSKIQHYYRWRAVPLRGQELCCVAKPPQDSRWYRASIREKRQDRVEVLLVDYGIGAQVTFDRVQRIIPEHLEPEAQAFRCSLLHRMEPLGTAEQLCGRLRGFVADGPLDLRCKIVSQSHDDAGDVLNFVELHNALTRQSFLDQLLEQSLVKEREFVYSPFDLAPNDEVEVYVTHVSNEWDVYCQLKRNADAVKDLETGISEQIGKMKRACAEDSPSKLCLTKYSDGNWYRALVRSAPSPLHLDVFFVDYGNAMICEKSRVLSIPGHCHRLLSVPAQASKFRLASVSGKDLDAEAKKWLDKAVLDKELRAVIVDENPDGSFDVVLFDGDLNINRELRGLIGKVSSGPGSAEKETPAKAKGGPVEVRPKPQKPPPSLPDRKEKRGDCWPCFVSHVDSADRFFLQRSDDEAALLKINQEINATAERFLRPVFCVRLHQVVLARYDRDAALYRAVVTAYKRESRLAVTFVDYGNTAVVEKKNLYALPRAYLSQPAYAIRCRLADSDRYRDGDFGDAVAGKMLAVQFVRKTETSWAVDLEILRDQEETDDRVKPAQKVIAETTLTNLTAKSFKSKTKTSNKIRHRRCKTYKKKSVSVVGKKPDSAGTPSISRGERPPSPPPPESRDKEVLGEAGSSPPLVSAPVSVIKEYAPMAAAVTSEFSPLLDDAGSSPPVSLVKEYAASAASVTSPSEFSLLLDDTLPLRRALFSMLEDLSRSELPLLPERLLSPGTVCLFRSDLDSWRRARVVRLDSTGAVLDLVDDGFRKKISRGDCSDLRRVPKDLPDLPDTSRPCVLNGVKPAKDGRWSPEAAVCLREVLKRDLKAVFRGLLSEGRWSVDVLADGVHVAKELVDAGHAEYTDAVLGLRFQMQSCRRIVADAEEQQERARGDSTVEAESGDARCVVL